MRDKTFEQLKESDRLAKPPRIVEVQGGEIVFNEFGDFIYRENGEPSDRLTQYGFVSLLHDKAHHLQTALTKEKERRKELEWENERLLKQIKEWGIEIQSLYEAWDSGRDKRYVHESALRSCLETIVREYKALKENSDE